MKQPLSCIQPKMSQPSNIAAKSKLLQPTKKMAIPTVTVKENIPESVLAKLKGN